MIPLVTDYYTHEFNEEEGVTAAFFVTKTGTRYRVYFYPARDFFDYIEKVSVIYNYGYYFGFTKVEPNENKREHFDAKVRNTIVNVINEFFNYQGNKSILIFHCINDWGNDKKFKRAKTFEEWFKVADCENCFRKFNEEIVVNEYMENNEIVTDKEYLSLIIQCENDLQENALNEFQELKEIIISGRKNN